MLSLLLLAACSAPPSDPARGGRAHPPAADTASPWEGADIAPVATWSPDEALAHLDVALSGGIPTPMGYRDAFAGAMDHAGGGCPRYEDPGTTTGLGTWFSDGCTADGWTFTGVSVFFEEHTQETWDFGGIASFELTDPAGALFLGGGSFAHERAVDAAGTVTLDAHIGGTYRAPWAEGWLADGVDVGLWMAGTHSEAHSVTTVNGGITGADAALYLDAVTRDAAHCDGAPQGELRLRDPSGGWYTVTLEDCSGCGDLAWAGESVGTACPGVVLDAALAAMEAAEWAP